MGMTREEEIKARLEKATPSPWVATEGPVRCPLCDGEGDVDALTLDAVGPWAVTVQVYGVGTDFKDHETFLHHAPEDIRYLLDRNDELQRRVEKMERVVGKARALSNTIGNPFVQHAMLHAALPRLIDNLQAELEGLDAADAEDK